MPNGHTGINVSAPRAALDVRTWGLNTPSAIFGMHALRGFVTPSNPLPNVQYRYSRHLAIVPFLGSAGYNTLSQKGDIGLIFTDGLGASGDNQDGSLVIAPWSTNSVAGGLRIDNLGNVVVSKNLTVQGGITVPGWFVGDFEIRGRLKCTTLIVNQQWWPDYVFDKEYKLISIDSLHQFIKIHHHLPNFPSQNEVTKNGQDVGQLQKLQQLKIEEFSLYLIEQQKQIQQLNIELVQLRNKILSLEIKLNNK